MTRLLHVAASPRGEASVSRRVAAKLISAIGAQRPDLDVVLRDLAASPLPHIDAAFARATVLAEEDRQDDDRRALSLSERLIAELETTELLVISTPMHNFTVPSALKAWLDHVLRPDRTFRRTSQGKVGLLANRPAFVVVGCGGSFDGDAQLDFAAPYLRYALGTLGIGRIDLLRLDELARGEAKVQAAFDMGREWIARQVATCAALA